MSLLLGALTLGFIFSLIALGVLISFRIFAFPDITADGSSTLGAALAAILLVNNVNPVLATAAGLSVLGRLRDPAVYDELERLGARLEAGLAEHLRVQRVGAMLTAFTTDRRVRNFDDAQTCDTERYAELFRHLLANGIYVAPSQFEAMFVSLAHSDDDIDLTVEAVGELCRDD